MRKDEAGVSLAFQLFRAKTMIVPVVQRWKNGRDRYRPAGEVIDTSKYEITEMVHDRECKEFVCRNHYSRSYPAARFRYGLYRSGELVGAAVFSHPCNDKVLSVFETDPLESTELGRFVLDDSVEANGESWFLARCFEDLRKKGIKGVVSFSDPMSRTTMCGEGEGGQQVIFGGHIGVIYQAHNGIYLGRGTARTLKLLPDGTVFSDRAISKIRNRERGWRYAASILVRYGADVLAENDDSREWLDCWLPVLTRNSRHKGNHKYVWALDRKVRKHLPESQAYPKVLDGLTYQGLKMRQEKLIWM